MARDVGYRLTKEMFKQGPSASLSSEDCRILAELILESSAQLSPALEELESLQSEISMLVEAARESCSKVQIQLSNLSMVASYRGTDLLTLLQQSRSALAPKPAVDHSTPPVVALAAATEEQQAALALLLEDQG